MEFGTPREMTDTPVLEEAKREGIEKDVDINGKMLSLLSELEETQNKKDTLTEELDKKFLEYNLNRLQGEESEEGIENLEDIYSYIISRLRNIGNDGYDKIESGELGDIIEIFSEYFNEDSVASKIRVETKRYQHGELARGFIFIENIPVIEVFIDLDDGGGHLDLKDGTMLRSAFMKMALEEGIRKIND